MSKCYAIFLVKHGVLEKQILIGFQDCSSQRGHWRYGSEDKTTFSFCRGRVGFPEST